jgi:hypothetical protein
LERRDGATAQRRQEFVKLYEDYVVIGYSAHLSALVGESFKVLGSHPDKKSVIVASRIQINGAAPIGVDWQLNRTDDGYRRLPSDERNQRPDLLRLRPEFFSEMRKCLAGFCTFSGDVGLNR